MDIDSYWEYGDPAASEARFRSALDTATGDERLELLTQIARTYSLRQDFAQANQILDEVESQLAQAGPRPQVRILLERGRVFNSSGDKDSASPFFAQAFEKAQAAQLDGLAVDAAHMLAIVFSGTPQGLEWNQRGLELARASQDAKARGLIPAMLNNLAWELHDLGRFEEALPVFEAALVEWSVRGKLPQIQIAKWSVARCLRSLGRYEPALAIQRALEAEHHKAGKTDQYVLEEIAENLAALGKPEEAGLYRKRLAELQAQGE
jgi:tetratricopeptide (TPR) repeat protein